MTLLNDFLSLIFPRVCHACGNLLFKNEEVICISCLYKLPKTNFHLEKENSITEIFAGRIKFESATSYLYFVKAGKVQHLIHQMKYKGIKEIGIFLGELYGNELKKSELFNTIEVVIPVPLHKTKLKKRGFNQSELFARGLSSSMKINLDTKNLYRKIASETQTRKTKFERWKNVEDIFDLKDYTKLSGKHVLLVDDVITTGSTLEASANALNRIKDIKISIATMAYAYH